MGTTSSTSSTTRQPFDRAARDRLRRRPVVIAPAEAKVMLVGDSRAKHVLVDPLSMRVVSGTRTGIFGVRKRLAGRVTITDARAERRMAAAA